MNKDFSIVFEKLEEASTQDEGFTLHADAAEMDEIAELRRLVLEITDPEMMSYTTT